MIDFIRFAENASSALALVDAQNRLAYANRNFCATVLGGESGWVGSGVDEVRAFIPLREMLGPGLDLARQTLAEQTFVCETDGGASHQYWCRLVPLSGNAGSVIMEVEDAPGEERLKEAFKNERMFRRQAEYLKQRGRSLFFGVLEELPVFVYMQRPDYTVAYANKKTKKFYGETEGRRCFEVFGGRTNPCENCPTFRVFETGLPENWQFTDSQGRTFRIYDYPFEDENGEPLVMELGIDVTELKRVERELFEAKKMRAIGVLAGGIAHDLNNNLVPIIFNIDYALSKTSEVAVSEPLDEALRAAYRAASLVEQVLEYSRQQNLSRCSLHLIPLAQENLELLQASLPANVRLSARYGAEHDCVMANPAQIQQLLLNLCRNAVQAMPDGGMLTVSVDNTPHDGVGRHGGHPSSSVFLRISDTGCGIEPDKVERIFEPFYTSKRNSGGTGMGLAVVHSIVASNGGRVLVDSVVGHGSTFTVEFPVVPPAGPVVKADQPASPASEKNRLLLVDDDRGALNAMSRILRDAGFDVTAVGCAEEGYRVYRRAGKRFDLVLTDQSMPVMTGIEMARRILGQDPAARIVVCTGHVAPDLEAQARAAGIAGFLMKPMSPRSLVDSIRQFCG